MDKDDFYKNADELSSQILSCITFIEKEKLIQELEMLWLNYWKELSK